MRCSCTHHSTQTITGTIFISLDAEKAEPLQPFITVTANGYEVLHGPGQVFVFVVYQAEMTLEFEARYGEFDEAARFDFLPDQATGQDGYT